MQDAPRTLSKQQALVILLFCAATIVLLPLGQLVIGALIWGGGGFCLLKQSDAAFKRRIGMLFICVALLAMAPIDTDRSNTHFAVLSFFFGAVVLVPALVLRKTDPGVIDFKFWPSRIRKLDVFYTVLSIPLAWIILKLYFFHVNPELPEHWPMPQPYTSDGRIRLLVGINAVGIWDELFFVNTVFAILRSVMPFKYANLAQGVVYTSVLYSMAFTGIGPFVIYYFALTQGLMYEKSKCLLWVLLVHILVDYFLVEAIMHYHYPAMDVYTRWF